MLFKSHGTPCGLYITVTDTSSQLSVPLPHNQAPSWSQPKRFFFIFFKKAPLLPRILHKYLILRVKTSETLPFHNTPAVPQGLNLDSVIIPSGCFACDSRGSAGIIHGRTRHL